MKMSKIFTNTDDGQIGATPAYPPEEITYHNNLYTSCSSTNSRNVRAAALEVLVDLAADMALYLRRLSR